MLFNIIGSDEENRAEFLLMIYLNVMEYFDKKDKLIEINDEVKMNDLIEQIQNFYNDKDNREHNKWMKYIKNYNEDVIKNFLKYFSIELTCFTTILGGIIAQEVIKATGKFIPIEQWLFFDFFKISENLEENDDIFLYK